MLLSPEKKIEWKQMLLDVCLAALQTRIDVAASAMKSAQESANSEDKSSAGDKYETGRAMSQLDRDMNARQLEEARSAMDLAAKISVTQLYERVAKGAVALSDEFVFFVGVGLGLKEIQGHQVICLSPTAPLTLQLLDKKKGDSIEFKDKKVLLTDVF